MLSFQNTRMSTNTMIPRPTTRKLKESNSRVSPRPGFQDQFAATALASSAYSSVTGGAGVPLNSSIARLHNFAILDSSSLSAATTSPLALSMISFASARIGFTDDGAGFRKMILTRHSHPPLHPHESCISLSWPHRHFTQASHWSRWSGAGHRTSMPLGEPKG